ncbi:hypothetical protein [Yoonia sp. 2307UL14-13]|uniref:hypothetical protein n=1 Tax=Yoonia sp. 2307UL14-13 TaxID=3126506 RepID=UPI00309B1E49
MTRLTDKRQLFAFLCCVWASGSAFGDYALDLIETGKRDYYCTITVALTNDSSEMLTEINAFFLNYVGAEEVGRSKGASFMNVAPGETVEATFETPNAPCSSTETLVESYHMVIGACRLDSGFADKSFCLERMDLAPPFVGASAFN